MNKLEEKLTTAILEAISSLYQSEITGEQIQFQQTKKEFVGDITVVVFPFLRISKKSPEVTAEEIGAYLLRENNFLKGYNVIKGFLNLEVENFFWLDFLQSMVATEKYGFASANSKAPLMVEYSSPNTNKPLHLGHLRNNFLGQAVANILAANGHKVIKVQIINDRGIHICKSMLAWQRFGNGETPETTNEKGDHLVGKYYVRFDVEYKKEIASLIQEGADEETAKKEAPIMKEAQEMLLKWENGDEEVRELWEMMNQWVYDGFEKTYQTMGVGFDKLYYESDTYILGKEKVLEHEKNELFYRKEDGSLWIDLSAEKLDDKLLLRADGTSVYMTQDLGTAIIREEEFSCEKYYYVVGNEQDYHFKLLKIILQKMDYPWAAGIEHLSYGMVDLPSGKMKSREGTVVDADDLMEEMKQTAATISKDLGKVEALEEAEKEELFSTIGLGALKYYILKVDPKKSILFDPEDSVDFNGNTGPFIQYAHARIQSILRKAGVGEAKKIEGDIAITPEDVELLKLLYQFPTIVKEAGIQTSPALIANYVYDLVKQFNYFYQNTPPIVKEEDGSLKNLRLCICESVGKVLKDSMGMLGISLPDRM